MDPDKEKPALLLPDGWVLCDSKSTPGRKYYFNRRTGKSSWTEPKSSNESCSNHKNKSTIQVKQKKEKMQKKCLKRKSEGHVQEQSKKIKKETAPQRHSTGTSKFSSPKKDLKTPKQTPTKQGPKKKLNKNLANARLSLLRSQLHAEVTREETSSDTNKQRYIRNNMSPNTSQTQSEAKTPQKVQNHNLISPSSNDSRCSTNTQSPSDSLNSHPSPSQFFTANKIISSMKAQLPDEYCSSTKQKDTFADIEKGISNQTAEYPYSKHPATPPQFSEASKLVSAIKSKLSYSPKDTIKMFGTAKERMEKFRASLSIEINESIDKDGSLLNCNKDTSFVSEAMEVEECKINENDALTHLKTVNDSCGQEVTIIVDTNIFIHELNFIKNVLNSHIKGYSEQPTLLVPWRVISELDRLKDNNNGSGAVCKRAKAAMDYLYKSLPENNRIKGQSLRDSNSHIYPCEVPDDEILNCCLQQLERGKSVLLLSNDKNLCNKGIINGVRSKSLEDLRPLLESKPLPVVDPELGTTVKHCKESIYQLLANILENEMRVKYNNLWQHVVFKPPPWTLSDVLQCILKHWIAVFNDVFPRIEQLITDLKNSLAAIENKDVKSISQFEASNFKELCLDVAKRCQIIPEYMHLAKLTVARIERRETEAERVAETKAERVAETKERIECNATETVIEAFENIWTVFSSYCAKLCERLGIDNNIEDKLEEFEDTVEMLISKWTLFTEHTNIITLAMRGALSVEPDDPRLSEHVTRLQSAFTQCLNVIGADPELVNEYKLTQFCIYRRNMLQEAHDKFTEVTELLLTCKNTISN